MMEYQEYDESPYNGMDPYQETHTAYFGGVHNYPMNGNIHTTKIAPAYAGTTSWFAYEEAVEDWLDITELEGEKRGPALRNRLEGAAAIYKPLLDRDELKQSSKDDPNKGVKYFMKEMSHLYSPLRIARRSNRLPAKLYADSSKSLQLNVRMRWSTS